MIPPPPPRTRAVVVGIEWDTKGPALDAYWMAEWLLGSGASPKDITALISPTASNGDVTGRGLDVRSPDRETVYRLFSEELPAEDPADALFVYWVGHGMTYGDDPLLAFADTSPARRRYLNVKQLLRWLRTRAFGYSRQTVLIDACRTYAEDLNVTGRPNCWDFDYVEAARCNQETLLAVPAGEPSIRPPGSHSSRFTAALRTELGTADGIFDVNVRSIRDQIAAHPETQLPSTLVYEGPDEFEEYSLGVGDGTRQRPAAEPGAVRAALTRLVTLLSVVDSLTRPEGRRKLTDTLQATFGADLFGNNSTVDRNNPTIPEIVSATNRMTDGLRVLHDVCVFRSDLFPPTEEAVVDLLAFLDPIRRNASR